MNLAVQPVAGRECGDCRACCIHFRIDDPALHKLNGAVCSNLVPGGCAIYDARPAPCREFYCFWRLELLPDEWRPDRSGVLLFGEKDPGMAHSGRAAVFKLIGDHRVAVSDGFAEVVVLMIERGHSVMLAIPGPVGTPDRVVRLKPLVEAAIAARDMAGLLAGIRAGYEAAVARPSP